MYLGLCSGLGLVGLCLDLGPSLIMSLVLVVGLRLGLDLERIMYDTQ